MARLDWAIPGTRLYEAGVDRGVLYVGDAAGIPWIGLTGVDENTDGGEAQAFYIDGEKYLNVGGSDEFQATIKAYTYPVEFAACNGTARARAGLFFGQQTRKPFGFSYRTMVGNDVEGPAFGYKIHLVYNALATPSERSASTYNDSVEVSDFSWSITTTPRRVPGFKSTSHLIVDSRFTNAFTLAIIEDILYGSEATAARLPTPQEIITIFDIPLEFTVTDNGGGKFFVGGPDDDVTDIGLGMFVVNHPSVASIGGGKYTIES